MAEQYTPTTEEIREYIEAADRATAHRVALDAPDAASTFDRWLAAHDAQVRESVIQDMRRLADARDDYSHPEVRRETDSVRLVADILDGKNEGWGWLPSWRWGEFGLPDPDTNHTDGSTS